MRPVFVFLISAAVAKRMIRISPKDHPDLILSIDLNAKDGSGAVKLIPSDKDGKKSSATIFEINDGTTEITQGESKICKSAGADDIEVCKGEDDLYSKWEIMSEDGSVRFHTEKNLCMEFEEKGKLVQLQGKTCDSNAKAQLFDIESVDDDAQDSSDSELDVNLNKDHPLEDLLSFLLKPAPNKKPVKQRVILFGEDGKKVASFRGAINPMLTSTLNPGILPHSGKAATSIPAHRAALQLNKDNPALVPSFANYRG